MSRLFTCGWETGAAVESPGNSQTVVTSPARSGGYSARYNTASALSTLFNGVLGRNYYVRAWIRFPANPSASQPIIFSSNGTTQGVTVRANTNGTLSLLRGTTVLGTTAALAVDTWHLVQLRLKHVSGVTDDAELFVNGVSIGSGAGTAAVDTVPSITIGRFATGTYTIYFDDVAINDDQGADENSWPSDNGAVIFLKPVADEQVGVGWQAGAGSKTNLWDAIDNTPPIGSSSPTNTSQIANNSTDGLLYDARIEPYASRLTGIVKLVQPLAYHGFSLSGGVTQAVTGVSNPASAQVTGVSPSSAVGVFPSNWSLIRGTAVNGDITDRNTGAVLRFEKVTLVGATSYCCQLGLMVEYVPVVSGPTYNDVATGVIIFTGTRVESWQRAFIYSDVPTGAFALSGSIVESYSVAKIYSDTPTGKLTLTGTCTSAHAKGFNDNPDGKLSLDGAVADTSQSSVTPAGAFKLSGYVGAAGRENTDTCVGVLALVGVASQTLAYLDQRTGKLTLRGTATDNHFIAVSDDVHGTLRLGGKVSEFAVFDGQTVYSDSPADTLMLSGRLIVPTEHTDYGIGGSGGLGVRLGRVVGSITGKVT
jgi:hypothetical protein